MKLEELSEKLHKRVVSSGVKFRVVGIKVRFTHFQTFSRENTLSVATDKKDAMFQEAKSLFREFEKNPRKVRLIGLSVSDFVESGSTESLESGFPTIVIHELYKEQFETLGKDTAETRLNIILRSYFEITNLDVEIAKEAAWLRCRHSILPTADAIIATTAITTGSRRVVTDDPHFKAIKEIKD